MCGQAGAAQCTQETYCELGLSALRRHWLCRRTKPANHPNNGLEQNGEVVTETQLLTPRLRGDGTKITVDSLARRGHFVVALDVYMPHTNARMLPEPKTCNWHSAHPAQHGTGYETEQSARVRAGA